ncbi:MAG: di-trans,poly-cis-decaprenylcistransferase [Chloroflexi bacterium]|nr:di-trans,poly-cis-decaprenylcistransferase [Chloroflexota bacterium]
MDGNGRWASVRGLPRLAGHRAGTDNIRVVLEACVEVGVRYLTIYAFSTENWRRPRAEIRGLFSLMAEVIERETPDLHRNGVRVNHLGWTDNLPDNLIAAIRSAIRLTRRNRRITLNVAFNYGGRADIVRAVRGLALSGSDLSALTETRLGQRLATGRQPDPDLVIRTAGEMRLSNFLIWQAAYAEYYSTPVFWPDFGRAELIEALRAYAQRTRKFGRVADAI